MLSKRLNKNETEIQIGREKKIDIEEEGDFDILKVLNSQINVKWEPAL